MEEYTPALGSTLSNHEYASFDAALATLVRVARVPTNVRLIDLDHTT